MEAKETRGQMTQRHKKELLALKKVRGKPQKELKEMEKQLREKHKLELDNLEKNVTPAPVTLTAVAPTVEQGKKPTRKQRRKVCNLLMISESP